MRLIAKRDETPECLVSFIRAQQSIDPPVNLTYDAFPRRRELCAALAMEQFGLCGYTGARIDQRITSHQATLGAREARPEATVEHLKAQSVCRSEVIARGDDYGSVVGDDLNYHNMIAVLKVKGADCEQFGEAVRGNQDVPIWPVHADCEEHFEFTIDGTVKGTDARAEETIRVLRLDHETLKGWRESAIRAFLEPEFVESREQIEQLVQALDCPSAGGTLAEFSFVIRDVARRLYLS